MKHRFFRARERTIAWFLAGFIASSWVFLTFLILHKPSTFPKDCPKADEPLELTDYDKNFDPIRILNLHSRVELCDQLAPIAFDDEVSMVIVNENWLELAKNLLGSLELYPKFSKVAVVAMDDATMSWCQRHASFGRTACLRAPFFQPSGTDAVQNTKEFVDIQTAKLHYVYETLQCGYTTFFFDADSVVLQDPDLFFPHKFPWEGTCTSATLNLDLFRMQPSSSPFLRQVLLQLFENPTEQPIAIFNRVASEVDLEHFCLPPNSVGQHCDEPKDESSKTEWRNNAAVLHANCMSGHGPKKDWLKKQNAFFGSYDSSPSSARTVPKCPKTMAFAVFSSKQSYLHRARMIQKTWGASVASNVVFFVEDAIPQLETPREGFYTYTTVSSSGESVKAKKSFFFSLDAGFKVVALPSREPTVLGARKELFTVLKIMRSLFQQQTWFAFFEDTEYVFLDYLCSYWVDKLEPQAAQYFGHPDGEVATLEHGLFTSNNLLKTIVPHLDSCHVEFSSFSRHPDQMLWRCIKKYSPSVKLSPALLGMQLASPRRLFDHDAGLRGSDDVALGFRDVGPDEMNHIHRMFERAKANGDRLTYKKMAEEF